MFFVGATVCYFLGITFATNQDAQKAVSDWFWSLGDDVKALWEEYSKNWVEGYNIICDWEVSGWKTICNSCYDFFNTRYYNNTSVDLSITASGDKLGFTPDTMFSFDIPEHSPNTTFSVNLGKSTLTIIDQTQLCTIAPDYQGFFSDDEFLNVKGNGDLYCRLYSVKSDDGLEWFWIDWSYGSGNSHDSTFVYPGTYKSSFYRNGQNFRNGLSVGINEYTQFSLFCHWDDRYVYKDGNGNYYHITQKSNGKYSFACKDTSVANLFDMEFDTPENACGYFVSKLGLIYPLSNYGDSVGVYVPGDTKADVTINKDRLDSKIDEVNNLPADSTVSTVLPGTMEYLDEMQANPDLVTDVSAEGVYNAEIPAIKSDPLLWQTKFPFCLPFDLYNLFTGFNSTAEAPVWHLLVLPENSFGIENEAIYFDIDFGANGLDTFVKYMRFFIAAAFVVWLIMISRKLIGGE